MSWCFRPKRVSAPGSNSFWVLRKALRPFVALSVLVGILLGLCLHAAPLDRNNPAQVLFPTRLAIPPLALGAMRGMLEQHLGRSVSLLLRPASSVFSLEDISSQTLLLTENGVVPHDFPLECRSASLTCTMGWILAAHRSVYEQVASSPPHTVEKLLDIMTRARMLGGPDKQGEVAYPWFESLFFPPTLRHLDFFLHGWDGAKGGTTEMLHQAMEIGLLNPLSVEADENLAYEVFEAGDSVFTSMWFPLDPDHPEIPCSVASGLVFLPFPGVDGPAPVPRVDLQLLVPTGSPDWTMLHPTPLQLATGVAFWPGAASPAIARPSGIGSPTWTWQRSDALEEMAWVRVRFPALYGKLIRGEP